MKQSIKIVTALIILGLFVACSEKKSQETRKPKLVKYETVGSSNGAEKATYSGIAEENLVIELSFRASGSITQLNVELGQTVQKGDLLATLDNVQSRLAYEQAVTQRNAMQSSFNTAKSALERARNLYEKETISLSDFEQAKNAYKVASENLESAKRGVGIQSEQINYGKIYAPESGTISEVSVEVNENINAGQNVMTLNAGNSMEIKLGVPESIINTLAVQDKVVVRFPTLPNQEFSGTITEIATALSSQSATYPVHITLHEKSEAIKSGMSATVTFQNPVENSTGTLVVPSKAVGEDYNGNYVFLIIKNDSVSTIKKHPITLGALQANGFEVKSGIKNGDRIAVAGLNSLIDGQEVRLH